MERAQLSEFYAKNVGLIKTVTRKGAARAAALGSQLTDSDIEQEMTEVFIRAFDSYDPSEFRFSTYYMRSAFNRLNYLFEKIGKERVDNKTYSVEEMSSWAGIEDDEVGITVEDVTSVRPDEAAQMTSLMRSWSKQLSPAGQLLMAWTIEPPEFIEREFLAQLKHAEYAKSVGVSSRARLVIDAAYVATILKKVVGRKHEPLISAALNEVKQIARNTL